MKSIDFQFEELDIPKTICLFLQCPDIVVGSFKGTCGYRIIEISQDTFAMSLESSRKRLQQG